eukprot:9996940-Ditylum_brightwellii.AAC.1
MFIHPCLLLLLLKKSVSQQQQKQLNSGAINGNGVEFTTVLFYIGVTGAPQGQFPPVMLHYLPSKIHDCIMLPGRLIPTTTTYVTSAKKEG